MVGVAASGIPPKCVMDDLVRQDVTLPKVVPGNEDIVLHLSATDGFVMVGNAVCNPVAGATVIGPDAEAFRYVRVDGLGKANLVRRRGPLGLYVNVEGTVAPCSQQQHKRQGKNSHGTVSVEGCDSIVASHPVIGNARSVHMCALNSQDHGAV